MLRLPKTMSSRRRFSILIVFSCSVLGGARISAENFDNSSNGWVPSTYFDLISNKNSSSTNQRENSPHHHVSNSRPKVSARAFISNQNEVNQIPIEYDVQQQELKAVPFIISNPSQLVHVGNDIPLQYQTSNTRPGSSISGSSQLPASSYFPTYTSSSSSYLSPSSSYGLPSQTYLTPPVSQGYQYPAPQYQPSPPLHLETFEFLPSEAPAVNESSLNGQGSIFVQPGRCSNSIQVSRIREVEVKTIAKFSAEAQKGICVLMLYATNESNKLAIVLQPTQGTIDFLPNGNWLQTNVKMYTTQAGDIIPLSIDISFGQGSPALLLTRSNIVILSFLLDRAVDFFLDISTYQSQNC